MLASLPLQVIFFFKPKFIKELQIQFAIFAKTILSKFRCVRVTALKFKFILWRAPIEL